MKNGGVIAVFTVLGFLVSLTILGNVEIRSKRTGSIIHYKRGDGCHIMLRALACYDFKKEPYDAHNIKCSEVLSVSAGCVK